MVQIEDKSVYSWVEQAHHRLQSRKLFRKCRLKKNFEVAVTAITTSDQRLQVKSLQHHHFPKGKEGIMRELLYTHCSWCLKSMEGVEESEVFALAKPFSDQIKASARRSSTSYLIPLAGKEISTLILGSGDKATARWLLCRQECSDALAKALEEEFRPTPNTHFVESGSTLDRDWRHPLTLSLDAGLVDLIKSKAVREKRDLTDITEELYRQYLTQGYLPDLGTDLLRD